MALPPRDALGTHDVQNQPAGDAAIQYWEGDAYLRSHAAHRGAAEDALQMLCQTYGQPAMAQAAQDARDMPPRLVTHDRYGQRLDEVRYHVGYHGILRTSQQAGYVSSAWANGGGGHVQHAAHVYLLSQIEPGACCPLTMSYAAVPVVGQSDLRESWAAKLLSGRYDASIAPVDQKTGVTLGMALTEKQGGSDLRSNATVAEQDGEHYRLRGHKWFCSAPMSDGFLTTAQTDRGLTCFLVPRWLDGERNGVNLMRLKSKLGNHANASAEIEYDGALAYRIGEEGDGVRTIIQMVHYTRLDTAIAPAGLMRAALREALRWTLHRRAFGARLVDLPLMQSVLADLALDVEAATALSFLVAQSFDGQSEDDRAFARVAVALAKYINNKRAPTVIAECMEVLGGMGYVEETPLPMLYREAPLNGIWEGSGNVICLDILRSLQDPRINDALQARLDAVKGQNVHYDTALAVHRTRWPSGVEEGEARWFCENLGLLLSAVALLEAAPEEISDAYVRSRLSEHRGSFAGAVALYQKEGILRRACGEAA
ncbi:acyl-CoA dehydrogenase family protein [Cognatishimia maritima]|uniref:Putative acyl-CoA dehydrogenase n=1 Tax=Cognatishimia maritima TaxID=870908 RepID=A0A1M5JG17_9RHOB|nr:acyl-CoA dehydrogenase family protein [Cognatishimia maritima]SHG39526.1 putative acyl-CoA dehydrogenase [Cognatishimia maritima]